MSIKDSTSRRGVLNTPAKTFIGRIQYAPTEVCIYKK